MSSPASLFSATNEITMIEKLKKKILSPFSPSSPLLFSTQHNPPITLCSTPNSDVPATQEILVPQEVLTQEFLERLQNLRNDDVIVANDARPAFLALQREADDLKSELLATRLQLEEKEMEIRELQGQLKAQSRSPPTDALQPVISKNKRKKMRKEQRMEADTTRPPGCDSVSRFPSPLPPPRPNQQQPEQRRPAQQQPQNQQPHQSTATTSAITSPPTIHLYHDSNADDKFLNTGNIQYTLDLVNKKTNKQTTKYNIKKHATYELQQTYNQIKRTTYKTNDIVIINILTNDARTTKRRPPKTLQQTEHFLNAIYTHLLSQLSPDNVVLLESPPLLYEDIFSHATLSRQIARNRGVRFAPTLIGEPHIKKFDGVHLLKGFHHLLAKAISCAVLRQNPHPLFGLGRPPQGEFGPWLAPRGQGMMPPSFSGAATRPPPYHFRPQISRPSRPIRPLIDMNIR